MNKMQLLAAFVVSKYVFAIETCETNSCPTLDATKGSALIQQSSGFAAVRVLVEEAEQQATVARIDCKLLIVFALVLGLLFFFGSIRGVFPIVALVLSSSCQRLFLEMLIRIGICNTMLVNILTMTAMVVSVPILYALVPWPGAKGSLSWFCVTVMCEVSGVALMTMSLSVLGAIEQSIISRGCEFFAVTLFEVYWPRTLDKRMSDSRFLVVCLVAVLGSIILPLFFHWERANSRDGMIGLLLVIVRSAVLGFQSIGEQVLMHTYAVSPGRVLWIESVVGMLLTVACAPLLSIIRVGHSQGSSTCTSIKPSLEKVWHSPWAVMLFLSAVTIQNAARVFVVRRHSAWIYQLAGVSIPGCIMILGFILHYRTDGVIGEGFLVKSASQDMGSFLMVLLATGLYSMWNRKQQSPLYLKGLQAQCAGVCTKDDLARVCQSGMDNANSSIGCYAHDSDDFVLMHSLFEEVSKLYHRIPALPSPLEYHLHTLRRSAPDALSKIQWEDIAVLRFRVARNVKGYPFSPKITSLERHELLNRLRVCITSFDERTDLESLTGEAWSETPMSDQPEIWPIIEYEHMLSAQILRGWPHARSSFKKRCSVGRGEHIELGVVVNEEDHLRFYVVVGGPDLCSAKRAYEILASLVDYLSQHVEYAFLSDFGNLATCPSNIGHGFKISLRDRFGATRASERRLGITVEDVIASISSSYDAGHECA